MEDASVAAAADGEDRVDADSVRWYCCFVVDVELPSLC